MILKINKNIYFYSQFETFWTTIYSLFASVFKFLIHVTSFLHIAGMLLNILSFIPLNSVMFCLIAGVIHIVLHQNSNVLDQLQSCFHAELINFVLENMNNKQVCLHCVLGIAICIFIFLFF